jgi:hypothetical protein
MSTLNILWTIAMVYFDGGLCKLFPRGLQRFAQDAFLGILQSYIHNASNTRCLIEDGFSLSDRRIKPTYTKLAPSSRARGFPAYTPKGLNVV